MTIFKKIFYASISLVLLGCEPIKLIYVNNLSDDPQNIIVLCDINKYDYISHIDSLFYYDSILVKPKWNNDFKTKLPIKKIDSATYTVILPGSTTVLLEPRGNITIREVIHSKVPTNDTLRLFPYSKSNISKFKDDHSLTRRSNILYSANMFIINIK